MRSYLSEILDLLGEQRSRLPGLMSLFLLASLLDLAGIGLIGPYIAFVLGTNVIESELNQIGSYLGIPAERQPMLIFLSLILIGIFLIKTASAIWINRKIIIFSQTLQARLRSFLMQSYQSMPYTDYLDRNSSESIFTIQELTGRYQALVLAILRTISDLMVAALLLTFLAFQNGPALLLLLFLITLLIFGYDRLFMDKMKDFGEKANVALNFMVQGIQEGISGLKEIRILGMEKQFHQAVKKNAEDLASFQTSQMVIATSPRFLLELILILFVTLLVMATLTTGSSPRTVIPTLGVFAFAALRLLPSATMISTNLANIRYGRDAVSRLHTDLISCRKITIKDSPKPSLQTQNSFQSLILERVSFSYPKTTVNVVKDISLEINAGEMIGFIGPSGSGKTTLVDLFLGLLEPQEGKVIYNGKKMKDSIHEWRSQVAYLPQEIFLIDNTLKQNVALGIQEDDINEIMVNDALKQARLSELVDQLPDGKNTLLGEHGVRISGGQRQRVALARAFYHGRNILVLDEATSSLDTETEREIVDEIKQFKGTKTMIVIAHRLTTLQYCDRIYQLQEGRIIKSGSPERILNLAKI